MQTMLMTKKLPVLIGTLHKPNTYSSSGELESRCEEYFTVVALHAYTDICINIQVSLYFHTLMQTVLMTKTASVNWYIA